MIGEETEGKETDFFVEVYARRSDLHKRPNLFFLGWFVFGRGEVRFQKVEQDRVILVVEKNSTFLDAAVVDMVGPARNVGS
jgi:hypothetical protein